MMVHHVLSPPVCACIRLGGTERVKISNFVESKTEGGRETRILFGLAGSLSKRRLNPF